MDGTTGSPPVAGAMHPQAKTSGVADRVLRGAAASAAFLLLAPLAACGPGGEQGAGGPAAGEGTEAVVGSREATAPDTEAPEAAVSEAGARELAERFGLPESVATAFLQAIEAAAISPSDRDRVAEELAGGYAELRAELTSFHSTDAGVEGFKSSALAALAAADFQAAVEALSRAVEADVLAAQEDPDGADEKLRSAAASRGQIGEIALLQLDYSEAMRNFAEAVEMLPESAGLDRGRHLGQLGATQLRAGMDEEAQANLEQSLRLRKRHLGNDHPEVAASFSELAELYRSLEDYARAEILYQRAAAIYEIQGASDSAEAVRIQDELTEVRRLQGTDGEVDTAIQESAQQDVAP
jgi:tetratricopeptide (TPR) repeat protein